MESNPDAPPVIEPDRPQPPEPAEEKGLPDPEHIVVEPAGGAVQTYVALIGSAISVILPLLNNVFLEDSVSPVALIALVISTLVVVIGIVPLIGQMHQRKVFWEATRKRLVVHLDNIGPIEWGQIRAIEAHTAGPAWLTGNRVVSIKVYPWLPMTMRRRMKPDRDVKYFVRRPVMTGDDRFIRLPVWSTKMREHGDEIAAQLEYWHSGRRRE